MKKLFKFEERIPATIIQHYEVVAETEEEAFAMVMDGKGFQDSFTDGAYGAPGEFELYDVEDANPESIICPGCSQTWCECE